MSAIAEPESADSSDRAESATAVQGEATTADIPDRGSGWILLLAALPAVVIGMAIRAWLPRSGADRRLARRLGPAGGPQGTARDSGPDDRPLDSSGSRDLPPAERLRRCPLFTAVSATTADGPWCLAAVATRPSQELAVAGRGPAHCLGARVRASAVAPVGRLDRLGPGRAPEQRRPGTGQPGHSVSGWQLLGRLRGGLLRGRGLDRQSPISVCD